MFNSRDSFYKKPFGAVAAGTPVTLRLRLSKSLFYPRPMARFILFDGHMEVAGIPLEPVGEDETHLHYQGVFTPSFPGILLYYFEYMKDGESCALWRDPASSWAAAGPTDASGTHWQLTVYAPDFTSPEALRGAVFYQIFPDRYYASGTPKEGVPEDRIIHPCWNEAPVDRPDSDGEFRCNDYFGGDLEGIRQKLPELAALGVEGVYLNPIFAAHSNHRYNTADYRRVDPLLGTNEDFEKLCADGEKAGIRFVLDGVFNHTGSDSIYFNREGRYGPIGAWNDPQSPYRDWFLWTQNPSRPYESWWGFLSLPNVNEESSSYQEFIYGENGVIAQWLAAGAAGFRLDVADELPDWFIAGIRRRLKAAGNHKLLFGEVWEDATTKISYGEHRQYLLGNELDSVMNYPWRTAILDFIREGKGQELEEAIMTVLEQYPRPAVDLLLNSLSTHDVTRAITALGGEPQNSRGRDWQREHNTLTPAEYYRGRQLFMLASLIQFTLPGCPCLYYGDEAGLVGYADPFNRGTYPWGREDVGLRDFFRILGPLRKKSRTLRRGQFIPLHFDGRCCVYLRTLGEESLLVAVNRSEEALKIPFDLEAIQPDAILISVGGVSPDGWLDSHSGMLVRLAPAENTE